MPKKTILRSMVVRKISVSIDENTYQEVMKLLNDSKEFRNLSHAVDVALNDLVTARQTAKH
jgi:metal-responsive CopG/Arc/MetJ family transcriptional regulator